MNRLVEITFSGLNIGTTLNLLTKNGIALHNVERNGKLCKISVENRHKKQIVALLSEKCYNICHVREIGAFAVTTFLFRHTAILVAFVFAVMVTSFTQQVFLNVETQGNYTVGQVEQSLGEIGITKGNIVANSQLSEIENLLAVKLQASYCTVQKRGNTLFVNATASHKATLVNLSQERNIVASCSGVVENIFVEQGTAQVEVGVKVNKGDVLISGKRTFNDGTTESVYALGKVALRVENSASVTYTGTEVVVDTGNSYSCFLCKLWQAESKTDVPFDFYRIEEKQTTLYPFAIAVVERTYIETAKTIEIKPFSEVEQQLKDEALSKAMENIAFKVDRTEYIISGNTVTAVVSGLVTVS